MIRPVSKLNQYVYLINDLQITSPNISEPIEIEPTKIKSLTISNQYIENIAPEVIAEKRKMYKGVSPNVDFYSGFVYEMLGIPMELYTAIFAIARIVGWSAHRIEELICTDKIIRPAYLSVMPEIE